jgi:hypothetical protein
MSDLTNLAEFARTKALDDQEPADERHLWTQIADEVTAYLSPNEPAAEAGLFDP